MEERIMDTRASQLSNQSRIARLVAGGVLIAITMSASGPLGYLSLLPLLAIYPVLTGMFGEDPINGLFANWVGGYETHCLRPASRVGLIGLGTAVIGTLMISPESLGAFGWVSIAAVYPILVGMFGEDLLTSVFSSAYAVERRATEERRKVVTAPAPRLVAQMRRRQRRAAVYGHGHHWFGGHGPKPA
jgi:hypothetical protein